MDCEWCRARQAVARAELEPGRTLGRDRYKPPKQIWVCGSCKSRVERLKDERIPVEVVRIT